MKVLIDCINYELEPITHTASVCALDDEENEKYIGDMVIPTTVTDNGTFYCVISIGDKAFKGCDGLTSITIPKSVMSIGNRPFEGCYRLTTITLPKSITEIGKAVLSNCENLQTIRVPQGMKEGFCKMGLEPWRDKIVEI